MAYTGLTITAGDYSFTRGDFEQSDWSGAITFEPTPKTEYTVGGVPKRSVPTPRFSLAVRLVFSSSQYDAFETFRSMFYDSAVEYLTVTLSHAPFGRSTNTLAMGFDGELKINEIMAQSVEVKFTLIEVPHVRLT